MEGWITLHRKLQDWEWYTAPNHVFLFVHLLLKANHKSGKWRGHSYSRGDVLTSLAKLSDETGLSKQNIRTILKNLAKTGEVNTLPNTKLTHLSVCKYDTYQNNDNEPNTLPNTELTRSQHSPNTELTTNNNDNNKNNDNNNKKTKAKKEYVLPSWINKETWADFEEMRKAKKKPMTDRARTTIINKLKGYGETKADQILEQSITHCWDTVYELKQDNTTQPEQPKLHIL